MSQKITGNTADFIRQLAIVCVERALAIRLKRSKIMEPETTYEINRMSLDMFIGARAMAGILGIQELCAHLDHVLMTQIDLHGYAAVEKLATRSSVTVDNKPNLTDN